MAHSLALLFLVVNVLYCFAQVSELSYQIGDELQYNLQGYVDSKGYLVTSGQRSSGAFSTMDSTVVVQVTDSDDSSYLFVMNMWGTQVNVGQGMAASETAGVAVGDWLGDDMYFQQNKTGEITNIWYESDDDAYLVQVKVGAINAFQTHIVAPATTQTFTESDPVGSHLSIFTGFAQPNSALLVNKTFTQKDVTSFADTDLHQNNIQMSALSSTSIHSEGYIQSGSVVQMVTLSNINPSAAGDSSAKKTVLGNDGPVGMQFSSAGNLQVQVLNSRIAPTSRTKRTFQDLKSSKQHESGNLLEVTRKTIQLIASAADGLDIVTNMKSLLKDDTFNTKLAHKIIRHLDAHPESISKLGIFSSQTSAISRQRIFYVLAAVAHHAKAEEMLLLMLQNSVTFEDKLACVFALGDIKKPSETVLDVVLSLSRDESLRMELRNTAFLTFSALLARTEDATVRQNGALVLVNHLVAVLKNKQFDQVVVGIHAIGNAGPAVVPFNFVPVHLLDHEDASIRSALVNALRKYVQIPKTAVVLNNQLAKEQDARVLKTLARIMSTYNVPTVEDSNFPFNKSYEGDYTLGGSTVNLKFHGELFAGTNFDCNQQYFNYEALAEAEAIGSLWSWNKTVFLAEAVYGKANGAVVGNEILLKVWDDVIYDQNIPTIDCNEHTYEIAHASPGFNVDYTLWVSIIPVVFSIGATLNLNLQWGWQICDSQLSALVELIPTATLTLDASAEIDLLIIKGGIELSGSFNTQLRPQGYIHGSECTVGFDVEQDNTPMDINLDAYYAWKECKYLIFDCHWGQHNQVTIFDWSSPSHDQIIFNQDWKIQP